METSEEAILDDEFKKPRPKNPDGRGREGRIINTVLSICIGIGFICFAFILLPDTLKLGGTSSSQERPAGAPANLSAIVKLDTQPNAPAVKAAPGTVRFDPEDPPPGTNSDERRVTSDERRATSDDFVAGGAGAAIDDMSGESRQVQASAPPEADLAAADPYAGQTSPDQVQKAMTPTAPAVFKAHPISSIARRDPSALDGDLGKQRKSWLQTPEGLEADVAFWMDVYAKYDRNQVILHHPRHLNIVYDVVDLSDIDSDIRLSEIEKEHLRERRVDDRRDKITGTLKLLATNPASGTLDEAELRIKRLFQELTEADAFKRAAEDDGVRAQLGQRDKFIPGLKYSGRYLGEIEAIFESYGLPRELTRLIFVESMFNPRAISSAGASGVFQFMRGTGKLYMRLNDIVDERNDPVLAAHAAARLLRHDYDALGSWPLAINAYNTGRGRMEQAVTKLGTTDIGVIIRNFDHPSYGFASRNFFLEYLAALNVAEHAEKYFGPIGYDKPLRFETVKLSLNISLPEVARAASIPPEQILELNPAFTPNAAAGQNLIPAGFVIRVPENKSEIFLAAAARAPRSRSGPVKHVVSDGESLESVAKMYGVEPTSILKSNKLLSRRLRAGQTIIVPVGNQ